MSTITEPQECILKGEQYGIAISEELSETLKRHTDNGDRANACVKLREKGINVGTSTIRDVTYRNNNLTESNALSIVELIEIAKENIIKTIDDAETSLKVLNRVIPNTNDK